METLQQYLGTKRVNMKPMNRQEYNDFRGWELPADEDGADEGYLVEYIDGGQANHPDFAGYVSWSPADVFGRAYKLSETWLDRLRNERAELAEQIKKLYRFFISTTFADMYLQQGSLVLAQRDAMEHYLAILDKRLELAAEGEAK